PKQSFVQILLMGDLLVMFAKEVFAEIALEIAPDRMNVVGVVLGVVVFQKEGWALNAIIVRLAFISSASPSEIDFPKAGLLNRGEIHGSKIRAQTRDTGFDKVERHAGLRFIQISG